MTDTTTGLALGATALAAAFVIWLITGTTNLGVAITIGLAVSIAAIIGTLR